MAALLALGVVAAACSGSGRGKASPAGGPPTTAVDECRGTQPGGQVVVYTTTGLEYWYADVLTNFQTDCAVQIAYVGASPDEILGRLRDEQAQPLGDLVIGPAPHLALAAAERLLTPNGVPADAGVPADRCARDRSWCSLAETYVSWVAGTSQPVPRTWQDLTTAAFSGQVLTAAPDSTLDGLALLLLLDRTMGRPAALAYLAALEHNVAGHYPTADSMSRVVSGGGALVADGDLQEHMNDLVQFKSLSIWFPSNTTLAIPIGGALIRGGPNAANAAALAAYLWSQAGQRSLGLANLVPGRPDVVPSDARSRSLRSHLNGIRIVRLDWEAAVATDPALVAAWQKLRTAPSVTAVIPTPTVPVPFGH